MKNILGKLVIILIMPFLLTGCNIETKEQKIIEDLIVNNGLEEYAISNVLEARGYNTTYVSPPFDKYTPVKKENGFYFGVALKTVGTPSIHIDGNIHVDQSGEILLMTVKDDEQKIMNSIMKQILGENIQQIF